MIQIDQIRFRLQETIRNSGLSQTELAKRLEIKQQTIAAYLSGKALPSLDTFANLCNILNIEPSYILCIKE